MKSIEEMNALELGAVVQVNFEEFWKTANVPATITTTWAADLAIALWFDKKDANIKSINQTFENAISTWKTNFEYFSQLIMAANFMAWFCFTYKHFDAFVELFSDYYYRLLDIAEKTLTKDEVKALYLLLD